MKPLPTSPYHDGGRCPTRQHESRRASNALKDTVKRVSSSLAYHNRPTVGGADSYVIREAEATGRIFTTMMSWWSNCNKRLASSFRGHTFRAVGCRGKCSFKDCIHCLANSTDSPLNGIERLSAYYSIREEHQIREILTRAVYNLRYKSL